MKTTRQKLQYLSSLRSAMNELDQSITNLSGIALKDSDYDFEIGQLMTGDYPFGESLEETVLKVKKWALTMNREINQLTESVVAKESVYPDLVFGKITIDEEAVFDGYYLRNQRWNGFLCTWFTKEQGMRMIDEVFHFDHMSSLRYDAKQDAFIYTQDTDYPDDIDTFKGRRMQLPDGNCEILYPIGNCSWTWVESDHTL